MHMHSSNEGASLSRRHVCMGLPLDASSREQGGLACNHPPPAAAAAAAQRHTEEVRMH